MKEQYINIRNSKQYDATWFYKYFIENGGSKSVNINQFLQSFNFLNLNQVLEFLDRKFDLTVLYNKNGEFIRVV
jgi:hypothetical protein